MQHFHVRPLNWEVSPLTNQVHWIDCHEGFATHWGVASNHEVSDELFTVLESQEEADEVVERLNAHLTGFYHLKDEYPNINDVV